MFDEAVVLDFMNEANRPKLVAKGKKVDRTPEFNVQEITAIEGNFDR